MQMDRLLRTSIRHGDHTVNVIKVQTLKGLQLTKAV